MAGHGMMGAWHSEGLKSAGCRLHTVVGAVPDDGPRPRSGRVPETTAEFAARYGYQRWTTSYDEALADPEIDVVILATPSETHADMAIAALAHGKHTLVEIPIAMDLDGAQRVVAAARKHGRTLGVVHPMRFRPERAELVRRVGRGEERVTHVHGRLFLHRLENVGGTGLQRSWTDNLLWHHGAHLVDVGLWTVCGGDMTNADQRVRSVYSLMPAVDPRTGIPMELTLVIETTGDQSVVVTGSYSAHQRIYDVLTVTDRDDYYVDEVRATLTTGQGERPIRAERENAQLIAPEFIDAVRQGREPAVPGWSVLPSMRVLQRAQASWDATYGRQLLPGRPVR
ncbi:MAG: Gfo/Idh/MocA family oxidoreductase [Actinobacteria bacterium]|nr:Gfo/Idh/MocA family oxidoreductase [Actinomycetota bacterium]